MSEHTTGEYVVFVEDSSGGYYQKGDVKQIAYIDADHNLAYFAKPDGGRFSAYFYRFIPLRNTKPCPFCGHHTEV